MLLAGGHETNKVTRSRQVPKAGTFEDGERGQNLLLHQPKCGASLQVGVLKDPEYLCLMIHHCRLTRHCRHLY